MLSGNDIPQHLIIGPYKYQLEVNSEEAFDWDHNARTFYRSKRISFNDKLPHTEFPQTLLHEALHTLGEAFEIKYWVNHQRAEKFPEGGDQIDLMATAFLMFLRSNKEVVEWLMNDA